MRVAAYQSDLAMDPGGVLDRVREQVRRCEDERVDVLCCPEAVLGGLADDADDPFAAAIPSAEVAPAFAPLASDRVTTIVGFTELADGGALFNSAAVLHRGRLLGVHRKLHPAINRSVYRPGRALRAFTIPGLTFGIVICNDSNHARPAQQLTAMGARVLFVPTNNALPPSRFDAVGMAALAQSADIGLATANAVWIVRADVAGQQAGRQSAGASGIVDPAGTVVGSAWGLGEHLLVAEIPRPAARPTAQPRKSARADAVVRCSTPLP